MDFRTGKTLPKTETLPDPTIVRIQYSALKLIYKSVGRNQQLVQVCKNTILEPQNLVKRDRGREKLKVAFAIMQSNNSYGTSIQEALHF